MVFALRFKSSKRKKAKLFAPEIVFNSTVIMQKPFDELNNSKMLDYSLGYSFPCVQVPSHALGVGGFVTAPALSCQ